MAAFRPPKSRKEMFLQAAVALGTSLLFGDTIAQWAGTFFTFIDLKTADYMEYMKFYVTVHGLVGAMSWGFWGGLAHYRDRFAVAPAEAVKEIKDDILK